MQDYTPKKSTSIIDEDKTVQNPGLVAFAHSIGGAIIRPEDMGKIKSKALLAMRQQTDRQMAQIYQQMQTLITQAQKLKSRAEISEKIYQTEIKFEPIVGHSYYLYERENGTTFLSPIAPNEWGRVAKPHTPLSKVTLLADHTWDVFPVE